MRQGGGELPGPVMEPHSGGAGCMARLDETVGAVCLVFDLIGNRNQRDKMAPLHQNAEKQWHVTVWGSHGAVTTASGTCGKSRIPDFQAKNQDSIVLIEVFCEGC